MNGAAWLLAMATLGVDYGWRLDKGGQLEYIIQIPPSQLETLRIRRGHLQLDSARGGAAREAVPDRGGNRTSAEGSAPAFTPGQDLGAVTPLRLDASRVNPAGGDFNDFGGLVTPALESTVTPIDDSLGSSPARGVLPGPATEAPSDPAEPGGRSSHSAVASARPNAQSVGNSVFGGSPRHHAAGRTHPPGNERRLLSAQRQWAGH